MNTSTGITTELSFEEKINKHRFNELNNNLQYFINFLFPNLDKSMPINCCRTEFYIKPDVIIWQKDMRANVSIKYGTSEIMHTEDLDTMIRFFRKNGIDERTIETYLLYHFGDGTTDGTGETRLSSMATRFKLEDRIKEMNKVFNNSKAFIKAFCLRVMFDGVDPLAEKADILYHGDAEYGVWITKRQMLRHIDVKNWNYMDCPHIGPFVLRPKSRYAEKEILKEKNRRYVVVTYPRLLADIQYISKRYNY